MGWMNQTLETDRYFDIYNYTKLTKNTLKKAKHLQ